MGWAIVVAKLGAEVDAEAALVRSGVTVYLPLYRRVLRGIRIAEDGRRVRTRGQGSAVLRPLLPPYLFAECVSDNCLRNILDSRCVLGILRYRTRAPMLIADGDMAKFRSSVMTGQFNKDLTPGDRVTIGGGAWEGHAAVFIEVNERGLPCLSIEILGREVRAEVASDVPLSAIVD